MKNWSSISPLSTFSPICDIELRCDHFAYGTHGFVQSSYIIDYHTIEAPPAPHDQTSIPLAIAASKAPLEPHVWTTCNRPLYRWAPPPLEVCSPAYCSPSTHHYKPRATRAGTWTRTRYLRCGILCGVLFAWVDGFHATWILSWVVHGYLLKIIQQPSVNELNGLHNRHRAYSQTRRSWWWGVGSSNPPSRFVPPPNLHLG